MNLSNNLELRALNCFDNKKLSSLDLSKNTNLVKLICYDCSINNLNLNNGVELTRLRVNNNQLTSLDFLRSVKAEKLIHLDVGNNQFAPQDLTVFAPLINLEELYISGNPFTGSCQPLQNLRNLKVLDIRNTDIDSGLEYLPESLERIYCNGKIARKLENYSKKDVDLSIYYDCSTWRKEHLIQIKQLLTQEQLETKIEIPPK